MSSDVIKLAKSIHHLLKTDEIFRKNFIKHGYCLSCEDKAENHINFGMAYVVIDNELIAKEYGKSFEKSGWLCEYFSKSFQSIVINRHFMFDVDVIEPFLYIHNIGSRYVAGSNFRFPPKIRDFCPDVTSNTSNWVDAPNYKPLVDYAKRLHSSDNSFYLYHVKDGGKDDIAVTKYSTILQEGTTYRYDYLECLNPELISLLKILDRLNVSIKEVYFVLSDSMKGKIKARKNPDGELTLTVY